MENFITMVKESHLVIIREPGADLLGYVLIDTEDSESKLIKLNEFFISNVISLDSLIGICCDGQPCNTSNGIL